MGATVLLANTLSFYTLTGGQPILSKQRMRDVLGQSLEGKQGILDEGEVDTLARFCAQAIEGMGSEEVSKHRDGGDTSALDETTAGGIRLADFNSCRLSSERLDVDLIA